MKKIKRQFRVFYVGKTHTSTKLIAAYTFMDCVAKMSPKVLSAWFEIIDLNTGLSYFQSDYYGETIENLENGLI